MSSPFVFYNTFVLKKKEMSLSALGFGFVYSKDFIMGSSVMVMEIEGVDLLFFC